MKRQMPLLIMLLSLLMSCQKNELPPPTYRYLHLAHSRRWANPRMDSLTEQLNLQDYQMLWLGGDLAHLSSEDNATMDYLDGFFNFSDPSTLWALGNHDYSNLNRIEDYTNRPAYYHQYQHGINFLVLDTQDSLSNIVGDQLDLVNSVLDTIQDAPYLVLLHHKLIWMYDHPELDTLINQVSNGVAGSCFYCLNPNNFYQDIYPKLVDLRAKGIEVLCIGGDLGFKAYTFEYQTAEGIHFLASGVDVDDPENQAIVFRHNVKDQILEWEFQKLLDLPKRLE